MQTLSAAAMSEHACGMVPGNGALSFVPASAASVVPNDEADVAAVFSRPCVRRCRRTASGRSRPTALILLQPATGALRADAVRRADG